MLFPFEVQLSELRRDIDVYVDAVFSCLQSEFMTLPKGSDFVEYPVFEEGYEALKVATAGFQQLSPESIANTVSKTPITLIVLRTMLGLSPPEWAYLASELTQTTISQNAARGIERRVRSSPVTPMKLTGVTGTRIQSLVTAACVLLSEGAPRVPDNVIHRLDKVDTQGGTDSLHHLSRFGVPYALVLYERYLGRPFAGHRDSVSELVGDVLEASIERELYEAGVSYRRTGRAERIPNFDQAPDFVVPNEFNPKIVVEAKVTEDDGTARDKVTRVQHLSALSLQGQPTSTRKFQVVAAIAGRGFKVRREDMKKLLIATDGKVFTLQNMNKLVECTDIVNFRTNAVDNN